MVTRRVCVFAWRIENLPCYSWPTKAVMVLHLGSLPHDLAGWFDGVEGAVRENAEQMARAHFLGLRPGVRETRPPDASRTS